MAQTTINNGETAANVRSYLNAMFTELFAGEGGYIEKEARSSGVPGSGDPADLDEIDHLITAGYSTAPTVILINKCDWHVYIKAVTTTTVTVGVGSFGSGSVLDYDLIVFKAGAIS